MSAPLPVTSRAPRPLASGAGPRWLILATRAAVVIVAALLAYFALRSSPYLHEIPWLPGWLARWADRNGVLRNAVAFFVFGLLWFGGFGPRWRPALTLILFAAAIETMQLWLPRRIFDLKDIAASLAGVAGSWAAVWLARRVVSRPAAPPAPADTG